LAEFKKVTLKQLDVEQTLNQQNAAINALDQAKNLQEKALLNRIAIRKSLAKYAAAEANIKLEVAKQTPDFSLSPGFAFDYGDKIWSLGFSTLLNLLQKHPTLINEATKLREIEGAQFELLQHEVISELATTLAQYKANETRLLDAKNQLSAQQNVQQKLQKQLAAGLVDKVVLVQAKLNEQLALQQIQNAQFDLLKSAMMLENVMQYPLFSGFKIP
jgi:outer membrane protein, heavy metal efflux system